MSLRAHIEVLLQRRRRSRLTAPPSASTPAVAPDLVEHRREEATSRLEALLVL